LRRLLATVLGLLGVDACIYDLLKLLLAFESGRGFVPVWLLN
jgi:hypothetical protein